MAVGGLIRGAGLPDDEVVILDNITRQRMEASRLAHARDAAARRRGGEGGVELPPPAADAAATALAL